MQIVFPFRAAQATLGMPDHEWSWTLDTALVSQRGAHLPCMEEILTQLGNLGWEGRDLFGVELTLEETLTNAIRHGNKLDPAKQVLVTCKASPQKFWLSVCDEGEGFIPDEVPDCTIDENLEAFGGRGLMLIRAYMTRVTYNESGNCVTLEKDRGDGNCDDEGME